MVAGLMLYRFDGTSGMRELDLSSPTGRLPQTATRATIARSVPVAANGITERFLAFPTTYIRERDCGDLG